MHVCIVGTGYVGLVTAACFAEMGNQVTCVDINPVVIKKLSNGGIHIYEPGLEDIVRRNLFEKRLFFTTDIAEGMANSRFVFNCVGTPPRPDGSCDLSYVFAVAADVGRHMQDYKIIINKSTVPVGTADQVREIVARELDSRGLAIDFDEVSNPEFLKEGDAINDFMKPDRIIIGTENFKAAELLQEIYAPFARSRDKFIVMGVRSAEMTKYAANCMLATKISFINEMANICEAVGADVRDVRIGIGSDHRIGYHFIYPGVGYGGSCFPKDVNALIHSAMGSHYTPELLTAVDSVNNRQKLMLAGKIKKFFESSGGIKGKVLSMWGLSFKANTDDIRDSAAIALIRVLTEAGMRVRAYDPAAGENARVALAGLTMVEVMDHQYDVLDQTDALAVVTDWNQFRNPDFLAIRKRLKTPVIFDGRNLYSSRLMAELGLTCFGVGRRPAG
jgi:UDPglucose 6-dehydrogenase